MKSMYLAFISILLLAAVADYGLDYTGFSTAQVTSGSAVRLD